MNGVYLVNRHELSEHQDKELQRFIDNNAHIMYFVDREKLPGTIYFFNKILGFYYVRGRSKTSMNEGKAATKIS